MSFALISLVASLSLLAFPASALAVTNLCYLICLPAILFFREPRLSGRVVICMQGVASSGILSRVRNSNLYMVAIT